MVTYVSIEQKFKTKYALSTPIFLLINLFLAVGCNPPLPLPTAVVEELTDPVCLVFPGRTLTLLPSIARMEEIKGYWLVTERYLYRWIQH